MKTRYRDLLKALVILGLLPKVCAHAQQLDWIRQWNPAPFTNNDSFGVSADSLGNAYITGESVGGAFVSKYDAGGSLEWTRYWTSSDQSILDTSHGVSADSLGNVYISGTSNPISGTNVASAFLNKYDSSGGLVWTRKLPTVASLGVSANTGGDVYITGVPGNFDPPRDGIVHTFLGKYDATGNLQWTRTFGTNSYCLSQLVAADSSGGVYIAGVTNGSLGGPNAGDFDGFLSKYDSSGNLQWIRQWGTAYPDSVGGLAVDHQGNVVVSGTTSATPRGEIEDAFVTKFDASGNLLWAQQWGTTNDDWTTGASADSNGNVYVSGVTYGSLGGLTAGRTDAFLSKFDPLGALLWTRQLGTSNYDAANGVSVDSFGNAYITGNTQGSLAGTFGGFEDVFIAKYSTIPEPNTLLLCTWLSGLFFYCRTHRWRD